MPRVALPVSGLVALTVPLLALYAAEGAAVADTNGAVQPTRVVKLAEVERAALDRQPQVLIARAATGLAESQEEQARAPLFPQLAGTASYTRRTGNVAPGAVVGLAGTTRGWSLSSSFDVWSVGFNATQLIYDFGQTYQRYRAAESNTFAAQITERATRLQVLFAVRRAYFNARAMKELVDVASQTLDDQNRHLTQVASFVQVGTQPSIALAQQRASVANAQVQLIAAQNNYETAKAQLNQAVGIPSGTDYDVANDEIAAIDDEGQPLDTLVTKALAARPEIASLAKQRDSQDETLRSAKGGYGPTLSAAAGASDQGTSLDGLVPNWNAGLVLNWPFFQGGLTKGQVHQAEAGLENLDAQRGVIELQVRLDVDSARLAVRAAKATIVAAQDGLVSASEQLRLAEQRFATGVGNIIELTDAQVAHTSAAAQVVTARYGLAAARAQLLAALGRT